MATPASLLYKSTQEAVTVNDGLGLVGADIKPILERLEEPAKPIFRGHEGIEWWPDFWGIEYDEARSMKKRVSTSTRSQTQSHHPSFSSGGHIRLLILLRGSTPDPIACKLEYTNPTDHNRKYEALSYE
jgi:hypothetical protein